MLNEFYIELRRHIERNASRTGYGGTLTEWEIKADEVHDPSLISQRFYGSRQYYDVVRIAAGSSFAHEILEQKIILLPSMQAILRLKKQFEVTNA